MTKEKLEDEICEYVHNHYKVAALGFSYRDLRDVAEHFALPREKRIEELERENAELKEKQKWLGSSTKCWFSNSPCRSCDEHDERLKCLGLCYIGQLTKAKELLEELVRVEYADFTNGDYSNELSKVLEQTEQFLKETK